jgi:anaphase-promoting complex subunit 2
MSTHIVPCIVLVYTRDAPSTEEARTMLQGVRAHFNFHVCKAPCKVRISEIWDIISSTQTAYLLPRI